MTCLVSDSGPNAQIFDPSFKKKPSKKSRSHHIVPSSYIEALHIVILGNALDIYIDKFLLVINSCLLSPAAIQKSNYFIPYTVLFTNCTRTNKSVFIGVLAFSSKLLIVYCTSQKYII